MTTLLNGPGIGTEVGGIEYIRNAQASGMQGGSWSIAMQNGWWSGNRQYTQTLRIKTTSPWVGPVQMLISLTGQGIFLGNYYSFPIAEYNKAPGSTLPAAITELDTGSFIQSITLSQESDDALQWLATITYGPADITHDLGTSQASNGSVDPLEMAPEVQWGEAKYQVSYAGDVNGNPFINTVGDPLENPPQTEETRPTLHFVRNELSYNVSWAQQYVDHVNSDQFLGYSPGQVKCKSILGQRVYHADYGYFWQVSYDFEFRTATFDVEDSDEFGAPTGTATTYSIGFIEQVLNAGLRQTVNGGPPSQITLNGALITSPVNLTQDGEYDPNAEPFFLNFTMYNSATFADLNIPNDVLTANQ